MDEKERLGIVVSLAACGWHDPQHSWCFLRWDTIRSHLRTNAVNTRKDGTYIIVMESNSPQLRSARLLSPVVDKAALSTYCLKYSLFMYGDQVGSFVLSLSLDGFNYFAVMTITGSQGSQWTFQSMEIGFFTSTAFYVIWTVSTETDSMVSYFHVYFYRFSLKPLLEPEMLVYFEQLRDVWFSKGKTIEWNLKRVDSSRWHSIRIRIVSKRHLHFWDRWYLWLYKWQLCRLQLESIFKKFKPNDAWVIINFWFF